MKKNKPIALISKPLILSQKYPEYTFIVIGILILTPFLIYDYTHGVEFNDFMVNLQGSVIEVFFLDLLVVVYDILSSRKDAIERYQDEIASFLPWK